MSSSGGNTGAYHRGQLGSGQGTSMLPPATKSIVDRFTNRLGTIQLTKIGISATASVPRCKVLSLNSEGGY